MATKEERQAARDRSPWRQARLAAGHTNAAVFAASIGVTPNTVYRVEGGSVRPSASLAVRWASRCSADVSALVREAERLEAARAA